MNINPNIVICGITLYQNPSGNIYAKNEEELEQVLEQTFFQDRYYGTWESIKNKSLFYNGYKPDYIAYDEDTIIFIEVENDEFSVQSWQQIMKYKDFFEHHFGEGNYELITINTTFDKQRKKLLEKIGVEPVTVYDAVKDYLVYGWM